MMHLGVYRSTAMFFGLTNLLATFLAIMNNILRDLINTGEVAVFMDNVLVATEEEKNDFLGLVIGIEGIKVQEEKVTGVLK